MERKSTSRELLEAAVCNKCSPVRTCHTVRGRVRPRVRVRVRDRVRARVRVGAKPKVRAELGQAYGQGSLWLSRIRVDPNLRLALG